jgi:aldose 1-epimerase
MAIATTSFGKTANGTDVSLFTLTNANGVEATIANYGGIVTTLRVPDRTGVLADVVLGYETLAEYLKVTPYFGCLVGRYGNRIANGRFVLDGREYRLAQNNGNNHLHGGRVGFDKVVWKATAKETKSGPTLELSYISADGEEGYPGQLSVKAVYTLTVKNGLRLDYTATTDKPTVLSLTQHSYFNLAGQGEGDILDHKVTIFADRFTPVDDTLIPTGELRPVKNTPLDFTSPHRVGERIGQDDAQLKFAGGYDHNWVLNGAGGKLALAASVCEPHSGRVLEVWTTEPAMQFYTGNFLDGTITGKGGKLYRHRYGFCMEPQHYPDSPNKPAFPSTVLRPGEKYENTIEYRFAAH